MPPWLSEPESVTRVTVEALAALSPADGPTSQDPQFGFEPNHIAAMPSIHVAAAALVFLAWRRAAMPRLTMASVLAALAALAYPVAKSVAVVYLGEHFILDALLGWVVSFAGWSIVGNFASGDGRHMAPRP